MKKNKKEKKEKLRIKTHKPPKQAPTKFMKVLGDWQSALVTIMLDKKQVGHVAEYIRAPNKKIYRRALSWEHPTLVIDSPILPAEHHIRLVRIRDKKIKREVIRALRRHRSR